MSLVASITFIIQRVKNTDERGLGKRDKQGDKAGKVPPLKKCRQLITPGGGGGS